MFTGNRRNNNYDLEEKLKAEEFTRYYLPFDKAIKQRVPRIKKKNKDFEEPECVEEYSVPNELKSLSSENFLISYEKFHNDQIVFFYKKSN